MARSVTRRDGWPKIANPVTHADKVINAIRYIGMFTGITFTPEEFQDLLDEFKLNREVDEGFATGEREQFQDGMGQKFAGRDWPTYNMVQEGGSFPRDLIAGLQAWRKERSAKVAESS